MCRAARTAFPLPARETFNAPAVNQTGRAVAHLRETGAT
jgi:hypothetical protein